MSKTEFQIGAELVPVEWERGDPAFSVKIRGRELRGEVLRWEPPFFSLRHEGQIFPGAFYRNADFVDVHLPMGNFRIRFAKSARGKAAQSGGGLSSPMPGKVIKVFVKAGDAVKKGDLLMMLEAMKMEHKISSPSDGVVKKILFQEGERVGQDCELLEIEVQK